LSGRPTRGEHSGWRRAQQLVTGLVLLFALPILALLIFGMIGLVTSAAIGLLFGGPMVVDALMPKEEQP
jgi:hypothetical protein